MTAQGKHVIEDLIIESSKFPAAQPPDPNQPAKIETDYWPCPPSLAVVGRSPAATRPRTLLWLPAAQSWAWPHCQTMSPAARVLLPSSSPRRACKAWAPPQAVEQRELLVPWLAFCPVRLNLRACVLASKSCSFQICVKKTLRPGRNL